MNKFIIYCFLLAFVAQSFSQNSSNQDKIKTNLEEYFHFERENIHVQFNKTLYISNENIAFKGYVFNKQSNLPNLNTTNVQLVVYDTQGQVIQKQLLHASLGTFEGIVVLDEKIASGKYHFHFYTNWMNNFMEDESFVQTIEVINQNEPYNLKTNQPNFNNVSITFNPESGVFIKGIKNTIGIQIKDCNELGIQIMEGFVVDSKGTTIATFFTNKMGYGKFELTPDSKETYSVKIATDKLNTQKQLPQTTNSGIAITYNNNLPNNVLEVSVKTNSAGINLYQNKNYTLLIHQNGKNIQKEFNFNDKNPTQILTFDKNDLSNGVNSIRIIDENLNEIGERLLYLNMLPKEIPLLETQLTTNDSIELLGKLSSKVANLSISILPINSACNDQNNSILGTFYLNSYLEKPEQNNYTFYDRQNVTRASDMELLMLNQEKSKYHWNNIMTNKPKESYKFTKGITINGTIVKTLNPKTKYKVALVSLKNNLYEEATVDKNNKFSFDNFFAKDSTSYQLELMNDGNMPIETKMVTNVLFNNEPFLKKLSFETINCLPIKDLKNTFAFSNADLEKKRIALNEIVVQNNYKKPILNHQNESTNVLAKAYKIGETDFGSVLDFIGKNGYATGVNEEYLVYIIDTRTLHSVNNSTVSPSVFIDDFQITDFNVLYGLDLRDVDEIYIDKTGTSNSSFGGLGTVKIYLKKGANRGFFTKKHTTLIVKSGFAKTKTYKSTNFPFSKEFDVFGTMQWSPNVFLDADQIFEVKFPKVNQNEIQVLIEGFTIDGQLISETKKLTVAKKM
ncbi:MAG: hypothetical protein JHC39_00435 [Lentimicrobium sp.]|nr:hypothetical protein [Lentimicrobium sp.]